MAKKRILDEETKRKEEIQSQIINQWVKDNYNVNSRRKPLKNGVISKSYIEDIVSKSSKRKYSGSYLKKLVSRKRKEILTGTASRLKYVDENIQDLMSSDIRTRDIYYKDAIERLYDIQKYHNINEKLFGFVLKQGYFEEFQEKLDNVTLSDAIMCYSPDSHSFKEFVDNYAEKIDNLLTEFVSEKLGYTS